MGVIAGAAVAIALPNMPKFLLVPLALLAGTIGGALWSFVPGYLRAVLGVNEILSTVMMNYIAVQFYGFLLRGPMIDPCRVAGRFRHASVGKASQVCMDRSNHPGNASALGNCNRARLSISCVYSSLENDLGI